MQLAAALLRRKAKRQNNSVSLHGRWLWILETIQWMGHRSETARLNWVFRYRLQGQAKLGFLAAVPVCKLHQPQHWGVPRDDLLHRQQQLCFTANPLAVLVFSFGTWTWRSLIVNEERRRRRLNRSNKMSHAFAKQLFTHVYRMYTVYLYVHIHMHANMNIYIYICILYIHTYWRTYSEYTDTYTHTHTHYIHRLNNVHVQCVCI